MPWALCTKPVQIFMSWVTKFSKCSETRSHIWCLRFCSCDNASQEQVTLASQPDIDGEEHTEDNTMRTEVATQGFSCDHQHRSRSAGNHKTSWPNSWRLAFPFVKYVQLGLCRSHDGLPQQPHRLAQHQCSYLEFSLPWQNRWMNGIGN